MSPSATLYALLADALLVLHFGIVAFIVLGLALIWAGYFARWAWVRGWKFRGAHLLAMGVVLAEALGGVICPLTVWENELRLAAGQSPHGQTFMQHWFGGLLFHDWTPRTFQALYAGFFLLLALTFWIVPPRRGAAGRAPAAGRRAKG